MKYLPLVTLALLLSTPAICAADEQGSLFRDAYACPDRGASSVCIYGTIPKGKQVTVIAKGWKSAGTPKGSFSNKTEEFQNGIATSTRLQVTTLPPKDAAMIAVLAPADAVNEIPFEEIQDQGVVDRIGRYVKTTNALNLEPDIRVLKTRLLRLSPTILLAETLLSPAAYAADLEKQLPAGCEACENVPLMVGPKLDDLFKEIRSKEINSVEHTCGRLKLAYTLSGRTYVLSNAFTCESDALSATLVHDVSGPQPKLVFKLTGGL